jgi:hypothetical protein
MPHDVLAVVLNQPGFALPNGLERRFKLGDSFKILRQQGDNFVVMDRHKLTHRGLDILEKFNFHWAFWHRSRKILLQSEDGFLYPLLAYAQMDLYPGLGENFRRRPYVHETAGTSEVTLTGLLGKACSYDLSLCG